MNETNLRMSKKTFFTGFNSNRYVLFNRLYPLQYVNQLSPITISLYDYPGSNRKPLYLYQSQQTSQTILHFPFLFIAIISALVFMKQIR